MIFLDLLGLGRYFIYCIYVITIIDSRTASGLSPRMKLLEFAFSVFSFLPILNENDSNYRRSRVGGYRSGFIIVSRRIRRTGEVVGNLVCANSGARSDEELYGQGRTRE